MVIFALILVGGGRPQTEGYRLHVAVFVSPQTNRSTGGQVPILSVGS